MYDHNDIALKREDGWSWEDIAVHYAPATAKQVRQAHWKWLQSARNSSSLGTRSNEVQAQYTPGTGALSGKAREPLTLEALMELSQLKPEEWDVLWCRPGYSEVGAKDAAGVLHVERLFNLQARLSPALSTSALEEAKQHVLEDIRSASKGRARPHATQKPPSNPHMAELIMVDIHLGMLSWRQETGADYDLHIVQDIVQESVASLLDESAGRGIDKFLFPVGNDFYHTDVTPAGKGPSTTKGTPQDVDGRWQKAFRIGYELMVWTINQLLEIAPVEVIVVPGNHDTTKTWYLGETLAARYYAEEFVHIDNRPTPRKYSAYGNSLLGFTHGDEEKLGDLPLIMAREAPGAWGQALFHEWHMGHFHHDWVREHKGVACRYLPALVGTDAWHHKKGFVGNHREAQLMLWSKENGRTATFHHEVVPSPEHVKALGPNLEFVGTPI